MANRKYEGIYVVEGRTGPRYGIDYIHPGTGRRIRKIIKAAESEEDALKFRTLEMADALRDATNKAYGLKEKIKPVLFSSMIDEYINWSKENKKSWLTDFYRGNAFKEFFKGKLMSDINPFMIEKYKIWRSKKINKRTVNKEIILGSQIYAKAIEWKKYNGSDNPFLKAEKFKVSKGKKPPCLSIEDVEGIVSEMKHPVKRDMVVFAFNTGWRIGEIRKLKWQDVDPEKGKAWIIDPKNGESNEIVLNDEAIEIIKRQKEILNGSEYVFCHKNGDPFKTSLREAFTRAADRAGVQLPPRKAWHILRRTWASMFLQNGGDVETLRQQGNWKDYSMPMWYANAGNEDHKKKILNSFPKIGNGRNMAESGKVVALTN